MHFAGKTQRRSYDQAAQRSPARLKPTMSGLKPEAPRECGAETPIHDQLFSRHGDWALVLGTLAVTAALVGLPRNLRPSVEGTAAGDQPPPPKPHHGLSFGERALRGRHQRECPQQSGNQRRFAQNAFVIALADLRAVAARPRPADSTD
ncbi:MAG: hypothetical protein MZV65_13755 [Chromatiales bacterium]|nr:hypothetical protein [Chromatiales bacterium]